MNIYIFISQKIITIEMELRVGGKYRLSRKLGQGAFGDIYHGIPSFFKV